jgi:signal transduction histidine kinase
VVGGLAVWLIEARTRERDGRDQIAVENERLYESMRFYARRITSAQEDERQRIARELHDGTIQMLIALSRRLEALSTLPASLPEEARARLDELQALVSRTVRDTRRFVRDLRPPALDLGLVPALKGLVDRIGQASALDVKFEVTGEVTRLAPDVELALYRIAQEALSNAQRHAGAARATVTLAFAPEGVRLVVEDDGSGFDVATEVDPVALLASGHLGLVGMRERAYALGGRLAVRSSPGKGTRVTVDVAIRTTGGF